MSRAPSPSVVRFDVFEVDLRAGELRRNDVKVRLQDLPFRALALFLSMPGEVVTREELRQALWPPDVFVDFEQGISTAVMRLREALGDSAEKSVFIQTVERRGYRWIAPVRTVEPQLQAAQSQGPAPDNLSVATQARGTEQTQSRSLLGGAPLNSRWHYWFIAVLLILFTFVLWTLRPASRRVRARASVGAPANQSTRKPANRDAEDFYLRGRFLWNKRTPESLNQAVDAFTQAIVHDPNYSDAYVGLADCYNLLREFSAMPPQEAFSRAFAAAKRAVELDPESSDAQASLAFVTYHGMWDPINAEKEYRRAIEINPNNARAHHWYATFLHRRGRDEDALAEISLARKLDPNSSAILADEGELLESAGQRDEAVRVLKQLEEADPDFVSPHRYLGAIDFAKGDYPAYIAEIEKDGALTRNSAKLEEADAMTKGLAKGGRRGMLEALLSAQLKLYQQGRLSPYLPATSEILLGNKHEALKYLNISLQSHEEDMVSVQNDKNFASLHGDPAFNQLTAKIAPLSMR